jgi:leader peptidase (prepilin peptidase)/N-methyltransferase
VEQSFNVNWAFVLCGSAAIALLSAACLPLPSALLSIALGMLMMIGADVDARSYLLPDLTTFGALCCGVIAAAALDPFSPWLAMGSAVLRAGGTAVALGLLASLHHHLSGREGLGRGDVKLGAAIGAWLPLSSIPLCFGLATGAALVMVLLSHARGRHITRATRVPLGAFLCPSLWLVFFAGLL